MRPHWKNHFDFITWYIEQFNRIVNERNTTVYFLGDFAIDYRSAKYCLDRLHGEKKVLVCGNHEFNAEYKHLFDSVEGLVIKKGRRILSHAGVHPRELEVYKARYNYHGHLHKGDYGDDRYMNVCVDYAGGKQVTVELTNRGPKRHICN